MKGFWFTIFSAFFSGSMLVFGKTEITETDPLVFVFYMALFAGAFGFLLLPFSHPLPNPSASKKSIMIAFIGHTVLVYLALWVLWLGIKHTTPVVASFLANTQVLFTLLLTRLFFSEKLRPSMLLSCLLIISGSLILRYHGSEFNGSVSFLGWASLIAGAMAFAIGDCFVKSVANSVSMIRFLLLRNILLTLLYGFTMIILNKDFTVSAEAMKTIVVVAVMGMLLARLFFNLGLRHWQLSKSILTFQVQPFFTAIWSYLILHELPTMIQWIGGILIISGIVIIQRGEKE